MFVHFTKQTALGPPSCPAAGDLEQGHDKVGEVPVAQEFTLQWGQLTENKPRPPPGVQERLGAVGGGVAGGLRSGQEGISRRWHLV